MAIENGVSNCFYIEAIKAKVY